MDSPKFMSIVSDERGQAGREEELCLLFHLEATTMIEMMTIVLQTVIASSVVEKR